MSCQSSDSAISLLRNHYLGAGIDLHHALFGFLLTEDEEVRDFLDVSLADLVECRDLLRSDRDDIEKALVQVSAHAGKSVYIIRFRDRRASPRSRDSFAKSLFLF